MGPFAENIAALRKRDPVLAEELADKGVKVQGLQIAQSRSGRPYLRLLADGINVPLEDEKDPAAEAKRIVAEIPRECRLVILKGFATGYLLKAIHARKEFERVVLIEPRVAFFAMMLGITDLRRVLADDRCEFFIGDSAISAIDRMKNLYNYGTDRNRLLMILPSFRVLRHRIMDQSREFDAKFDKEFSVLSTASERNRATLVKFLPTWRSHLLSNIEAILESGGVAALAGAANGVTGFLVAAGPSLDENAGLLAEAKGRAVIVAVDTAWRTLRSAGVVPDIVISVDATAENLRDFEGAGIEEDAALVMVPVVQPVIPMYFKKRFVASYGHPLQRWLDDVLGRASGSLLVSGSVSTIGYDLLRFMKASPIVIVGMDHAYGETTHTRGATHGIADRFRTVESKQIEKSADALLLRPAWGNGEVKTTREMSRWIEWFEHEIERSGWPTINATEGGASIKGTKEKPLGAVVATLTARQFSLPAPRPVDQSARKRLRDVIGLIARAPFESEDLNTVLKWESAFCQDEELRQTKKEVLEALKNWLGEDK